MLLTKENDSLTNSTDAYTLVFAADRPFVYLHDRQGTRIAELFVLSSVHALSGRDDTVGTGSWEVQESPEETVFSLPAQSSIWNGKTYRFRCQPHRFVYEMEVTGTGRLAEVNYFGGYASGQPRWGSGFFWSGQHFTQGFTPEPNAEEVNYFSPSAGAVIDLMGVPLPGKAHWFFTPPPFSFAFQAGEGWLGLGVEAEPGANRFTEYRYHGQSGFHLSLSYEGYTLVAGATQLPAIGFDFGRNEFKVLEAHVQALAKAGRVSLPRNTSRPAWWYEPIFCGWGAQCYLAAVERGRAPDYSQQAVYEAFLGALDKQGIAPGIVVLDDKWQATYGENRADRQKWRDLRGFIDAQHARGRRVLLWLKAWDPEGIPAAECITNAAGRPVAFDPSHPAFEQRLRQSVRTMLSTEGYDADGFKIDFSARIPSGPGMHVHGDFWGLELMKLYLGIVRGEAKQTKSDALIMTHTPHPYLADVVDMIRLNDVLDLNRLDDPTVGQDIGKVMKLRAQIATIACPDAIIDTDNWPVRDKASWCDYVRLQPGLGVPSLYFVDHVDLTKEPLETSDFQLIRAAWHQYRLQRQSEGL